MSHKAFYENMLPKLNGNTLHADVHRNRVVEFISHHTCTFNERSFGVIW